MIPDFKTYIGESTWGEMRRRSSGETIRKENNIDFLDQDGLFEYIKSHYEVTRFVLDNDHKPIDKKNQISIPFVIPYEASNYGFRISLEFNKNEKIITFGNSIKRDLPKVYKMICDNYRVERHTQLIDKLYPLDGSEITNQFYIDVIEFLIDNVEEDIKILKRI